MNWSDDAVEVFAELLAYLPSSLRNEVEEQAEMMAERSVSGAGGTEVDESNAVAALLECTPDHMRARVREALHYRDTRRLVATR